MTYVRTPITGWTAVLEYTCRKCGYTWRARFADKCLSCEHVYLTRKPA